MVRGEYATHSCLLIAADAQISFYIARILKAFIQEMEICESAANYNNLNAASFTSLLLVPINIVKSPGSATYFKSLL